MGGNGGGYAVAAFKGAESNIGTLRQVYRTGNAFAVVKGVVSNIGALRQVYRTGYAGAAVKGGVSNRGALRQIYRTGYAGAAFKCGVSNRGSLRQVYRTGYACFEKGEVSNSIALFGREGDCGNAGAAVKGEGFNRGDTCQIAYAICIAVKGCETCAAAKTACRNGRHFISWPCYLGNAGAAFKCAFSNRGAFRQVYRTGYAGAVDKGGVSNRGDTCQVAYAICIAVKGVETCAAGKTATWNGRHSINISWPCYLGNACFVKGGVSNRGALRQVYRTGYAGTGKGVVSNRGALRQVNRF